MIELSDDERAESVSALFERLFETRRYIRDAQRMIDNHDGHSGECCARGQIAVWRDHLEALNGREALITSSLTKMGETP